MIPPPESTLLPRSFFDRPVLEVAPGLLGRTLVRRTDDGPVALRLTGVEAHAGHPCPACHARRGRTDRDVAMFGPPGRAYVSLTRGTSRRSA